MFRRVKRESRPCFLDMQRGDGQIITQCWRVRFMMSPYILMDIPFIFGLKMQLKMVKPVWDSEWRGKPLSVNFRPVYFKSPGDGRSWTHRAIHTFEEPPFVSNERETTVVKGSLDNEATFEYHIDINHRGLSFWGEIDEDRNEELPTFFSIAFYSPNFIPNARIWRLRISSRSWGMAVSI